MRGNFTKKCNAMKMIKYGFYRNSIYLAYGLITKTVQTCATLRCRCCFANLANLDSFVVLHLLFNPLRFGSEKMFFKFPIFYFLWQIYFCHLTKRQPFLIFIVGCRGAIQLGGPVLRCYWVVPLRWGSYKLHFIQFPFCIK